MVLLKANGGERMKRIVRNVLFIMVMAVLFSGLGIKMSVQAAAQYKDMCKSEVLTKTKVKISWKKQKGVSGYTIYRSVCQKDGTFGSSKKIATVSSDKKSYTDKGTYKKSYKYEVVAFSKKSGIKTAKYRGDCYVYMGVGRSDWYENLISDAVTTPNSIQLVFYMDSYGLKPTECEIYRSKTKNDFKKIATVAAKKRNWGGAYTDKKVQYGESYYYKVRAVKKNGNKKIYGKFSDSIMLSAVKSEGECQVKLLTPKADTVASFDVMITSMDGNAEIHLKDKDLWNIDYCYKNQNGESNNTELKVVSYSLDGEEWKEFTDEMVSVKPEGKIYLRFADVNGKAIVHPESNVKNVELGIYDMEYNNLTCYMRMDFSKNTATVSCNLEYYH